TASNQQQKRKKRKELRRKNICKERRHTENARCLEPSDPGSIQKTINKKTTIAKKKKKKMKRYTK
uniref:Uncharacterized protein n=2 Tax=Ixodes scapularis TaxID=6945 RepID=A0A1S4KXR5_IXOSC